MLGSFIPRIEPLRLAGVNSTSSIASSARTPRFKLLLLLGLLLLPDANGLLRNTSDCCLFRASVGLPLLSPLFFVSTEDDSDDDGRPSVMSCRLLLPLLLLFDVVEDVTDADEVDVGRGVTIGSTSKVSKAEEAAL